MRRFAFRSLIALSGLVLWLTACQSADSDASPTRVNPTQLAETAGVVPAEAFALTLTARVPTITPSPTITPTTTASPTATHTLTPSDTPTPTPLFPDNAQANAVVYASDVAGTWDIWSVRLDGSGRQVVYANFASADTAPTCDPRGNRLIFTSDQNGNRELFLIDLPETTARPLTDTVGENYHPVWSPAGDKLAFISTRNGNPDIYIMDPGGGNVEQITSSLFDDILPSWSPDGQQIWFSSNRDGTFDIYRFDLRDRSLAPFTLTPNQNEWYASLAPNGQRIAYVAETTPPDTTQTALFVADIGNGQARPVLIGNPQVEHPIWLDDTHILVTQIQGERQIIQQVTLGQGTEDEAIHTLSSADERAEWPVPCFIADTVLSALPPLMTPLPSATPTLTPPAASPTPTASATPTLPPVQEKFRPVSTPPDDWMVSSETWIADEMSFIAPPLPTGQINGQVQAFLLQNLLNFVWQDAQGQHVLSMALEAFRGALEVTIIGYTINDFPGDVSAFAGYDVALRDQILLNSVRPGAYFLGDIQITDVNITFVYRVPALKVASEPPSQYAVSLEGPQPNWLISTERWTPFELARMFDTNLEVTAGVDFLENDQIRFSWLAETEVHVLVVQVVNAQNDLQILPASYTLDNQPQAQDIMERLAFTIREGLLFHSLPMGTFQLSRISFSENNMELVFLMPPARSGE